MERNILLVPVTIFDALFLQEASYELFSTMESMAVCLCPCYQYMGIDNFVGEIPSIKE